jgi:hypothetical protein
MLFILFVSLQFEPLSGARSGHCRTYSPLFAAALRKPQRHTAELPQNAIRKDQPQSGVFIPNTEMTK